MKEDSPDGLCLSPSWMRKDFSRTQSVESNLSCEMGIFGSMKERKLSESRTPGFTSSAETLDDNDDDVYWRLKHKVKKKKRRNQSGPSDARTRENRNVQVSSTKDSIEPLNANVEPIMEAKEELFSGTSNLTEPIMPSFNEISSETTEAIPAQSFSHAVVQEKIEVTSTNVSMFEKTLPNEKLLSLDMDVLR